MKISKSISNPPTYQLAFKTAALKEWESLDGSIKSQLKSALKKRLQNPHIPASRLKGNLKDCYKIKLLKSGYRLVYTVSDMELVVLVLSVNRRDDSLAYTLALQRLKNG